MKIWFWQLMVSPHMAGLAKDLSVLGVDVVYVAQEELSRERVNQGWDKPALGNATLKLAPTPEVAELLAFAAPIDAVHICQGVRGNGQIKKVQKILSKLKRKQWVVMETVDDGGWRGLGKRLVYSYLFRKKRHCLQGVLASGRLTPQWVVARGVDKNKVFPFAYFLSDSPPTKNPTKRKNKKFRLVFVGQLIERKRLDFLIDAVAALKRSDVELAVIGFGPLEYELQRYAEAQLPGRVDWIGRLPIDDVRGEMAAADCLVLPSRHDGWGAVVSESLMVGTPVVCSDACGASEVAYYSGVSSIFKSESYDDLVTCLNKHVEKGRLSEQERQRVSKWASSLSSLQGARYLLRILEYGSVDVTPPWR